MTTIVFPGQGSQYMGMSKDFFDNYSIVRETFELIQDISKINIKEIIFENPSDLLNQTPIYPTCHLFCFNFYL